MRHSLARIALLLFVVFAPEAQAVDRRYTGTLRLLASVGTTPEPFLVLSVPIAGTADVSGAVVRIPAGAISAAVPPIADFAGTVVNGPATFSGGGAGVGSTCPLSAWQEVCIDGGHFGGSMRLSGVTQLEQDLTVWGQSGSSVSMTGSGLIRTEQARLWTEGRARAVFYIPEIDATPFGITETGTFLGLPGNTSRDAGFSLVAPMIVTAQESSSLHNLRAIARLQIVFSPPPVPVGAAGILAVILTLAGMLHLRYRSTPRPANAYSGKA